MQLKLTPRLALVFILFAFGPFSGAGTLAYSSGRIALQAAATEKEAALEGWIRDAKAEITALTRSAYLLSELELLLEAGPDSASAHDRLVSDVAARTGSGQSFMNLFIISVESGRVVAPVDPSEAGDVRSDFPYFIEGKKVQPACQRLRHQAGRPGSIPQGDQIYRGFLARDYETSRWKRVPTKLMSYKAAESPAAE